MKMKLTKREIRAVEASIRHWKKDIQAKLLKGIKINCAHMEWADTGKEVKCYEEYCSLCRLAFNSTVVDEPCELCPYHRRHGFHCADNEKGHWQKFQNRPNLQTCNRMIRALEKILE